MRSMMSLTLGNYANNNKCSSGPFTVYKGRPVGFSYRIQEGQLSEYIERCGGLDRRGEWGRQSDGSYKLTYDASAKFQFRWL